MKAAIYIRVSTQEQTEGFSIDAQKDKLINYCKAKDYAIQDIYIDGGFSGSNLDRPAMAKLMRNINEFNVVLVYKLDRLSRSQKDTLFLIEEFNKKNIGFVSLQESFDTTTAFGRAMVGILSVFAQLERETIIERSKMGKDERAKRGLWKGGVVPIGYDFVDGYLIINEYEAMQVRQIFELSAKGWGYIRIADEFADKGYTTKHGNWANKSSSVRQILLNRLYLGELNHLGKTIDGQHDAIITEELFDSAQAKQYKGKKNKTDYLLSGLVYCECGSRMVGYTTRKSYGVYKYYGCYSATKKNKHMVKTDCKAKSRNTDVLEERVYMFLERMSLDQKIFMDLYSQDAPNDNDVIYSQIANIEKQIDKLMDLYQNDKIPTEVISSRITKLYDEKKTLEDSIIEEKTSDYDLDYIWEFVENFADVVNDASFEELKIILNNYISKIIVGEKISIEWKKS